MIVRKNDPGKIFIDYGNGAPPEVVTQQELPTWLNHKAQFNKGLDPVKLNELYPKYFGTSQPTTPENNSQPTTPVGRAVQAIKKGTQNVIGKITGKNKSGSKWD